VARLALKKEGDQHYRFFAFPAFSGFCETPVSPSYDQLFSQETTSEFVKGDAFFVGNLRKLFMHGLGKLATEVEILVWLCAHAANAEYCGGHTSVLLQVLSENLHSRTRLYSLTHVCEKPGCHGLKKLAARIT
jgi:hypothetical protein